jgi:hypothetical protein
MKSIMGSSTGSPQQFNHHLDAAQTTALPMQPVKNGGSRPLGLVGGQLKVPLPLNPGCEHHFNLSGKTACW